MILITASLFEPLLHMISKTFAQSTWDQLNSNSGTFIEWRANLSCHCIRRNRNGRKAYEPDVPFQKKCVNSRASEGKCISVERDQAM